MMDVLEGDGGLARTACEQHAQLKATASKKRQIRILAQRQQFLLWKRDYKGWINNFANLKREKGMVLYA